MPNFTDALKLVIDADVKGAVQGIEKLGKTADRELSKSEKSLDKWGNTLTKTGAGMIAFGGAALVGLGALARESEQANLSQVKLQNTIDNMPRLAGQSSKQFTDLADSIQDVTAADADAIVEAEALLGTFNQTADQIKGITPLVVDYARKFGIDIPDAAIQVGKALDGQVGALKRNGVSIDETLFKTDRYRAVQEALSDQVGGFAEAEGKTFAGSLERMKNQLGDLAEGVGVGAVNAFETMFGAVGKVAGALESISPSAQETIGQIATFGAVALVGAGALNVVAGQAILARANIAKLVEAVKGLSFANLAVGLGVIAPLTVGAGIALAGYSRIKGEAKRVTDGYVEALSKETGTTRDAIDAYSAAELAAGDFGSSLRRSNADIDLLNRAIREQGDVLDDLGGKRDVIRDRGFETAMRSAGIETSALTDELSRLEGEMSKGEFDRLIKTLDALSDGYDNATEQTRNQKFAEGDLATQVDETGGAFEDATQDVQTYSDTLRGLTDPVFAAANAITGVRDAQLGLRDAEAEVFAATAALNEAMASGDQDAIAEATRGLEDANRNLSDAQWRTVESAAEADSALAGLQDAVENGDVSVDQFKTTLGQWVTQGFLTQQQADLAAASVGGLAGQAAAADQQRVDIPVSTPGAAEASNDFLGIKRLLDGLDGRVVNVSVITRQSTILAGSTNVPRQQHGGPVEAGRAYIVGEKRPELFVPDQNGMILPSVPPMSSPSLFGGGGGSATTVNYQLVFNGPTNDRQVVEAIKRFESTNGTRWRN